MFFRIHNLKCHILYQYLLQCPCQYHLFLFMQSKKNFNPFLLFLTDLRSYQYDFSQAFWLNLTTLWSFFKTNSCFNVSFKFLNCIMYSVLSCKLATSFSTFSISILCRKNGKLFQDIEYQLQKNILPYFFHYSFLGNFH